MSSRSNSSKNSKNSEDVVSKKNKSGSKAAKYTGDKKKRETHADIVDKCNKAAKSMKKPSGADSLTQLNRFMEKFRNKPSDKKKNSKPVCTHTVSHGAKGSFNIPEDYYSQFKKLYTNALYDGNVLHINETRKEQGPILLDFDFVQPEKCKKRMYTEKTIVRIVRAYNRIIRSYLNVSSNNLEAYVTEKKKPTTRDNDKYYHDGIHIMYPFVCTQPELQLIMRNDFIKIAAAENIFDEITLVNGIEDVVDKNVITGLWPMYGSVKNPSCYPYLVTHVYQSSNGKIYETIIPNDSVSKKRLYEFVDALSRRKFLNKDSITPLSEKVDTVQLDKKLETLGGKFKKDSKHSKNSKDSKDDDTYSKKKSFFTITSPKDVVDEARDLLNLLSDKRSDGWYSWLQVGRCLHNIDNSLLEDWIKFSKKSSKFKKGECETLWKKMKYNNMTIASLHYFAMNDNRKKYLKLKESKIDSMIKRSFDGNPRSIAKIIIERYKYMFRCASIRNNIWYEFKNHRWNEIDSAYSLRNLISDDLTIEYGKKQMLLYQTAKDKEGYEKDTVMGEAKVISKIIYNLQDPNFKNKVIRECADLLHDKEFANLLDENMYLIGFNNGVYDLEAETFRDGCPDDFISLYTKYDYIPLDKENEYYEDIKQFFKKIQPEKEERCYLKTLLSTCLAGCTKEQKFYIFIGKGANGKSTVIDLMKKTLGNLFKAMDIKVLVGNRSSASNATPELADKKGIRLCTFDEPRANDEINTTFFKLVTGGEDLTCRALYKEQIYFKPQFKPILLCNVAPRIRADDDGTSRRPDLLRFCARFFKKSEIPKKKRDNFLRENQYWADLELCEKIGEWKQTFAAMLIEKYKKYKKFGMTRPKSVKMATDEYLRKCDTYRAFLDDYIEVSKNDSDYIKISVLYEGWRQWFKQMQDGKPGNVQDLRGYVKNRLTDNYKEKQDILIGYKIKTEDDDAHECLQNMDFK